MLIALALVLLRGQGQARETQDIVRKVADSGRCVMLADDPNKRVDPPKTIAPGLPPLLSFRYYEDKKNHRFANLDLMLDDAGH
jgi:hypothetical protein